MPLSLKENAHACTAKIHGRKVGKSPRTNGQQGSSDPVTFISCPAILLGAGDSFPVKESLYF